MTLYDENDRDRIQLNLHHESDQELRVKVERDGRYIAVRYFDGDLMIYGFNGRGVQIFQECLSKPRPQS